METYEIIYKDIEKVNSWEDIVKRVFEECFEEEQLQDQNYILL